MLEPKLNICLVCDDDELKLQILDMTGSYDNPNNLTGFGTPNIETTDVASTELAIAFGGNTYIVDTSAMLPEMTGTPFFLTYLEVTGVEGTFPDGKYDFEYTITDNLAVEYTLEKSTIFYNTVACTIMNEIAGLPIPKSNGCCEADKETLDSWLLAYTYLQSLKNSICLADLDTALSTLSMLQSYVEESDCGCS